MRYPLTGLSICSSASPIETYDQLGGHGRVWNKALAIPAHLNQWGGPWASIEYVSIDPVVNGEISSVGTHRQQTDEIYYILSGTGTLTTNGQEDILSAGWLSFAPRGTTHSICNRSPQEALTFFVIELQAKVASALPACVHLAAQMKIGTSIAPIRVAGQEVYPRTATLNAGQSFGGAWGLLSLLELPPGARVGPWYEESADQLIVFNGFTSAFVTTCRPTESGEKSEDLPVHGTGEEYQCLLVPAGVPCRLENRASGYYPASVFRLTVPRTIGGSAHA